MSSHEPQPNQTRRWIARSFTLVEDVVYIGLALLLAGGAFWQLWTGFTDFIQKVPTREGGEFIKFLDKILLVLLVVELLYTVQVSFREHALVPEPFLLVGLISAIRLVLVLTAEHDELRGALPNQR